MKFLHVMVLTAVMLLSVAVADKAHAVDVTTTWTANTEADLSWYRVYQAPGACTNPGAFAMVRQVNKTATAPPATTAAVPVTVDGVYCFKATAGDTANNESIFSQTSEVTVNAVPPQAPQNFRATVGQ